jgi:2-polyprenyl-3-methyl-5-hydroxy-6-metoxy-1,4-benzoquinol methylase
MEFTSERVLPREDLWNLYQEHLCRYHFAKKYVQGKKVLDAGCGEGYGTDLLADLAHEITGIDISEEAIRHAQKKYRKNNLSFKTLDCTNLKFLDEKFDVIVSFEVLEHVEHYELFLSGIKDVLKCGGIAIISSPNVLYSTRRNLPKHPFHVKEFEPEELRELLSLHFSDVRLFGEWNKSRFEKYKSLIKKFDKLNLLFPMLRMIKRLVYGNKPVYKISVDEFSIEENNLDDAPVILAVCRN